MMFIGNFYMDIDVRSIYMHLKFDFSIYTSYAHGVFGNPITLFGFAIEKLASSNWISKYTMCVTGVN